MEAFDQFLTKALTRDFFAGGLALGALGVALTFLRVAFMALYRVIVRRVWITLTLDNRSAAYRHSCIWMEQNNVLSHSRHVRMTDGKWARETKGHAPAPGWHWFFWRGKLCRLERDINEQSKVGASHNQRPMEVLNVTVLFGKVETILGLIAEGRAFSRTRDRIGPGLHILKGDWWDLVGDVPRRSVNTVLVDDVTSRKC